MNMHFKRTQITRSRLIGLLVILGVAVLYLTAQPASLHAADYDGEFDISQNVLDIGVGGTYRVYDSVGTPTGNHITVTASDPVILYLDGVRITSPDAPPIDLNNGADVTIILMNDAMNTLT
ncbi:MAG: carbohydrate-binding domain-containing protein, partial [Coriobacteriales bacterium]|nr:carbohydrate-binding domain-containing protein [Coriobacteriales bacterium]